MSQQQVVDVWQTGAGLVDNVDAYIQEPYFGIDERYNPNAVLFCANLVDKDGEPVGTLRLSIGDGWVMNQEQTEISHPNRAQVNQNSRFGRFIDRLARPTTERAPKNQAVKSPPGKENGLGLIEVLRRRGTPFQAKTFDGLGFHWDLHEMETLGRDEQGAVVVKQVLFPTKFIGEWASKGGAVSVNVPVASPAAAPAPAAAAAPAATPAAATAPTNGAGTMDPTMSKKLQLLALQNDKATFLRTVARDPQVLALPESVLNNVLDASAEGFHAKTNG